ncbi:MAG: PKD domain-containing protein [Terrimonas sp.]|nr:PKD domain-containing protein [Terrimonas sp.]
MNRLFNTLLLLTLFSVSQAQTGNIEFVENKGQWDSRVRFKGDVSAGAFYIRDGGFTVLQYNAGDFAALSEHISGHSNDKMLPYDPQKTFRLRSHSYNVEFVGSSKNFQIVPDKPVNSYNNYFIGNDPSKWAGNCRIYQAVTVRNIYPNTDIRYYTENGQMKYDIIARPGADISKIVMRYEGADKLEIRNKQLFIATSVGTLKELEPYSYQYENGARAKVNTRFMLNGNELRFDVKSYNRNETLVIDPTLIFCSFSGSAASNWGFTATYGPDGSFYGGGIAFGTGFPVSPGAFDGTFGGGTGSEPIDIGIIKLTPNGANRVYATYIGGGGNEQPHSIIVDPQGNLVIAGRSNSSDYPTVPANSVIGTGGSFDIIVTKLNATGSALIGSKKIGGTGDDGVNISPVESRNSLLQNYGDNGRSEVILDGGGNIYVASSTQSTASNTPANNFPVTAGAFQVNPGGDQDGVVLKFDPNLNNLLFASYLGGLNNDACYVLALAPNGNIYVGGGTASDENSFPGNKAGTIHPTFQGGIDGFLAIISNNGSSIIRATYLGTSAIDQVYGVQFDNNGFPYVMGQTGGNWPVSNATYSVGGAPQFIAKLQPDLSAFVYSTRFGKASSNPNISPVAFLVDNCENVYVSGWGGDVGFGGFLSSGTAGMPTTADALKSQGDPIGDFYFFVLQKNATSMLYGSFFGQQGGFFPDHVDGGTSRFDKQGVVYQAICANCGGGPSPFPTTPGVWSTTNQALGAGAGDCNLAMVKIAFNFAGVDAGPRSSINGVPRDTSGCVPLTVDFTDTIANAVTYYWNFGDGSPQLITTTPNASHTYVTTGTFQVMLIAEDSTTCNIRDTSFIHIRVGDLQALLDFNPVKLAPCDSLKFRFDNLSSAPGVLPFSPKAFHWDFGDGSFLDSVGTGPVTHSYAAPGSYVIKLRLLDTAYCNYPDSLTKTINIAPNVVADFTTPATGCVPYNALFTNTSVAGQQFQWDFGDGNTSGATSPSNLYVTAGTFNVRLIAIDPNTCNGADTIIKSITIFNNPVSNFSTSPIPAQENTPTTFNNLASADAVNFKWIFGDGDSLLTASRLPVQHQYIATGTYNACLVAINANGCADTLCQPVEAIIIAQVDVPNAFTPNSNDINNKIMVRGFGITRMKFIIWNRWGQQVFESSSINAGWDGKYKGVLQPMDVYAYTLDVEFFDGTKTTKKGDITLIR